MRRAFLLGGAALLAAILAFAAFLVAKLAPVAGGFAAKNACSMVFVSGRTPDGARADLAAYRSAPLDLVDVTFDDAGKRVTAALFGLGRREAAYREGFGCVLDADGVRTALPVVPPRAPSAEAWPRGDGDAAPAPSARLAAVLDAAFTDAPGAPARRTRAVVVVQRGRLAAERYADGATRATRFAGWSMTKSVAAALVGTLVADARLALDAPFPLAAWRDDAARRAITLRQLLHMSSGLAFDEDYGNPLSDVVVMLFRAPHAGAFAAAKPLAHPPGAHWSYASGTTNVVMLGVRETLANDAAYWALPRAALFDRAGMTSALIEPDPGGTFVGSSFMYATARDWARFGVLVLQEGTWEGERIVPEDWVRFMRAPAPTNAERRYGAHWWLGLDVNTGANAVPRRLPADAFHASGHGGQFVTVVPSRAAVVVRFGHAVGPGEYRAWNQDAFAADVLEALE